MSDTALSDGARTDAVRVLLVGASAVTSAALERADPGLTVTAATDGALDRLAADPVDCVVVDDADRDPLSTLRAVRERDATLPVVLLATDGSERLASDAIAAGVTDYLPVRADTDPAPRVASRVRDAVDRVDAARSTDDDAPLTEGADASVDRDLLARAVDEAPIGVTISGPARDGVPLAYVNGGFERLTGYDREDVLGRNCDHLQGADTAAAPVERMRAAIRDAESTTVELRNYRADGTEFWNRVTIAPLPDEDGDPAHFVGFQQDVTDRKRRERRLQSQIDQFQAFGSVLAHDLRSPLTAVGGRIELARDTGDVADLDGALAALDRLEALIEDLASVMREGELAADVRSVSLADVARDVWGGVESGGATLSVEDTTLRADADALGRLLGNLFTNAIDHAGPAAAVSVRPTPSGFAVEDDGPGVPPAERAAVLEFGYSTKDADSGTGIGLASVARIAAAHGWEVAIEESEAGGARFAFSNVAHGD